MEDVMTTKTIDVSDILKEASKLLQQNSEKEKLLGLFTVKPITAWIEEAKNRPIPKMLFSEFWFEGELCILFSDTNMGKSILSLQIGDSISKGISIPGFKLESEKQKVLFYDFELNSKQIENRYSVNFENHYQFDRNLIRIEINPDSEIPEGISFEDYLFLSIEKTIQKTEVKILIIDNLTYLKNGTETAKDALPLMKHLKALKNKYKLSILALAHTPKRDLSKPITRNDLQGSKMLINFCDSSFAIGESHNDKGLRYLKQIKARNTEIIFDSENVVTCQVCKPNNFLQLEFLNYGIERDYLKTYTDKDKESMNESIIELKQQGNSFREIGNKLGISHQTVKRIWDKNTKL